MDAAQPTTVIDQILQIARKEINKYLANPTDRNISDGNVSICIVDENGQVYGEMWGNDKNRQRNTFQTAWRKASQVWITGIQTGKYEELVYTNKIDSSKFGINKPDFIGWEGGWLVTMAGDIKLAVAVSGMRGETDSAMVADVVKAAGGKVNHT
jgi:uncharacterized protein GlcG (DUF336 family)